LFITIVRHANKRKQHPKAIKHMLGI